MHVRLISNLNISGLHAGTGEPLLDELTAPMGLLCLASSLSSADHAASLVDLNYAIKHGELRFDDHFIDRTVELITAEDADVYALSTMCNSFHVSLRLASALKSRRPTIPILMGGPQVSFVPKETLSAFSSIDFVLKGECDSSIVDFANALERQDRPLTDVPGLFLRQNGIVVQSSVANAVVEVDDLPMPAWDLFPYDPGNSPSIDVGRGCPFACEFCSTSVFFQRSFRLKSFERIAAEMRFLRDRYKVRGVNLIHDLFTANKKWVRAFCEYIVSQPDLSDMTWAASARIDTVNPDLLKLMARAGCRGLFYGVESGSQRMQAVIGKRLKISEVTSIATTAQVAGIKCTMSFIAGFPQETLCDLQDSFRLLARLLPTQSAALQMHLMSPMVGTPDFNNFRSALRLDGYYSDISSSPSSLLELDWFRQYPDLFCSFYYYENNELPRELLRGVDLFVRLPCTVLRRSILGVLKSDDSLWDLYLEWRNWLSEADRSNVSLGILNTVEPDEVIVEFLTFLFSLRSSLFKEVNDEMARDELIAFYLARYHDINAAWYQPEADVVVSSGPHQNIPGSTGHAYNHAGSDIRVQV